MSSVTSNRFTSFVTHVPFRGHKNGDWMYSLSFKYPVKVYKGYCKTRAEAEAKIVELLTTIGS